MLVSSLAVNGLPLSDHRFSLQLISRGVGVHPVQKAGAETAATNMLFTALLKFEWVSFCHFDQP
jgi:hypothetical protein